MAIETTAEVYVKERASDSGLVELVEASGERFHLRFPFFGPDEKATSTVACTAAEADVGADAGAQRTREPAWVCFTLLRSSGSEPGWRVVDVAVAQVGSPDASIAEKSRMRWSCPDHPSFQSATPRACAICDKSLEPMMTCPDGTRHPPRWACSGSVTER